jgi:hypothetical protein
MSTYISFHFKSFQIWNILAQNLVAKHFTVMWVSIFIFNLSKNQQKSYVLFENILISLIGLNQVILMIYHITVKLLETIYRLIIVNQIAKISIYQKMAITVIAKYWKLLIQRKNQNVQFIKIYWKIDVKCNLIFLTKFYKLIL